LPEKLPLSKLEAGTRVLAADSKNKKLFAKVVAVHHSPASEGYLDIRVLLDSKRVSIHIWNPYTSKLIHADQTDKSKYQQLRVTRHHTFPVCRKQKLLPALALKVGDCLHTSSGQGIIQSIEPSPATKRDRTYTLVLEDNIDMVAIGGIFTRAKAEHAKATTTKSVLRGLKHHINARL